MSVIKRMARGVLARTPYIAKVRRRLKTLEAAQGAFDAGSYFSPIPDATEVARYHERGGAKVPMAGVNLARDSQLSLLKEFAGYYPEVPFQADPTPPLRYHLNCTCFGCADGILLHSVLRHFRPRRVVEIGTGWSSTVIMDTLAQHGGGDAGVTFVEPWPDNVSRLKARMTAAEANAFTVLGQKVQDVDPAVFGALGAGDLLFIASSHVIKCGNDLQRLLFEVLPSLPPGVLVQFHGIHHPFEYPREWLAEGRFWNEAYLLRAFLSYNDSWEILLFNNYAQHEFEPWFREHMPLCLKQPASSLYLRRVK